MRRRRFDHRGNRRCSFESLDARLPLAGNITAGLQNGELVLTGDSADNAVTIQAGPQANSWTIVGRINTGGSTTTINGQAQVTISNVTGKIFADLGAGNDDFLIKGIVQPVGLEIYGGDGNDIISIGEYATVTNTNPLIPATTIQGALVIDAGADNDTVFVGRVYGNAAQTVTLGSGADRLDIYINFCGALTVNGGIGDDSLFFGYTTTSGILTVEGGTGNDLVSYYANRAIQNAYFTDQGGYDNYSLDVNVYDSDITCDTGDSIDTLLFSRSIGWNSVFLRTGAGNDTALIGKYYTVVNGQTVLSNAGSSVLSLSLNLGTDNDTAEIAANVISYLEVMMGTGTDLVTLASNLSDTRISLDGQEGTDRIRRSNNSFTGYYTDHGIETYENF